jgi:hypothetical protein
MPKIISYTPPWLSRPTPGSQAFTNQRKTLARESPLPSSFHGPHRLLAHRGTEIFTVVGNEIRWLDLRILQNDWEERTDPAVKTRDFPHEHQQRDEEEQQQQQQEASQLSSYRVYKPIVPTFLRVN